MRTYNVHIGDVHLLNEALNDVTKRNIIIEDQKLEDLDRKTALFSSFKELEEELNQVPGLNDAAVIILLDKNNKGLKIVTSDIVYADDMILIQDKDSIKEWTLDYLKKNPSDIRWFNGIKAVYKKRYGDEDREYSEEKVISSIYAYFNNADYSVYRNTYFALKAIDPSVRIISNDKVK